MSLQDLADYTMVSRYANYIKELQRRETYHEATDRVKNMHLEKYPQLSEEINWAFEHVHNKIALGSQRALQFGGKPIVKKNAKLYNCISTYIDRARVFQETFWLLLCGCGTGFSVQKHHVEKLPEFHNGLNKSSDLSETAHWEIEDSIEGWADALGVLIACYMPHAEFPFSYGKKVDFDFTKIRPKGSPLGSGVGKAPGPDGLKLALEKIRGLLNACLDAGHKKLRPIDAYDIVMHASDAVLSGGVRRSATLAIFSPDDQEMLNAKTGDWYYTNPQRARSNNSALLLRNETGLETYHKLFDSTRQFGEPGMIWASNTEALYNPCVEIGLYAYNKDLVSGWQACNLSTINGSKLQTKEDFAVAAKVAAIIGTLQAGYTDFAYLGTVSEEIIRREALLGVSITGIMDHPSITLNPSNLKEMAQLVLETNSDIAAKIAINEASRTTCVKPEGSASCLLGTSSGIHPAHAKRYIRRVQSNAMEAPIQHYKIYNPGAVEKSVWSANGTDEVINFLIEMPEGAIIKKDMTALQFLDTVKMVQENWVESGKRPEKCVQPWLSHNVSNTITVQPDEWDGVEKFIYENRESFAGISLLGGSGDLDYNQAPFTEVLTEQEIVNKYGKGALLASGLIVDGLHAYNDNLWQACDTLLGVINLTPPKDACLGICGHKCELPVLDKVARFAHRINCWIFDQDESEDYLCSTCKDNKKAYSEQVALHALKVDWIRRAKKFAENYLNNDLKLLTYLLKDLNNFKFWQDRSRDHRPVNWELLYEEFDDTKVQETVACAGGKCEMS